MFKPRYANKSFGRLTIPAVAATSLVGGYFYYRTPAANPSTGGQAERTREKRDKEALGGAGIGQNAMSGGHETGQPGSGVQPGTGDVERTEKTTAPKEKLPAGGVGGGYGGGNSNLRAIDVTAKKGPNNDVSDSMSTSGSSGSKSSPIKSASSDKDSTSGSSSSSSQQLSSSSLSARSGASARSNGSGNESLGSESADYKVRSQSYPTSQKDYKPNTTTQATEGTSMSQKLQGMFGQGGKKTAAPGENQKMFDDPRVQSNHADAPTKRHQMRSDS